MGGVAPPRIESGQSGVIAPLCRLDGSLLCRRIHAPGGRIRLMLPVAGRGTPTPEISSCCASAGGRRGLRGSSVVALHASVHRTTAPPRHSAATPCCCAYAERAQAAARYRDFYRGLVAERLARSALLVAQTVPPAEYVRKRYLHCSHESRGRQPLRGTRIPRRGRGDLRRHVRNSASGRGPCRRTAHAFRTREENTT
jgi:hypothetical protein